MTDNITEFGYIWENVIIPVYKTIMDECDPLFISNAKVHFRGDNSSWQENLEHIFHEQRHKFKEQCYGKKEDRVQESLLDSRKVAAVLCQTLCLCKPISFNLNEADKIATQKKIQLESLDYTKWAVNNTLINYKFAYLASQSLVYLSLLADLLSAQATPEMLQMGKELNKKGHLFRYSTDPNCDTMDVNIIVALARGDIAGQDLNMLLFAMLLYQSEMYTRSCLN